jgi:hypothetical protein
LAIRLASLIENFIAQVTDEMQADGRIEQLLFALSKNNQ